MITRVKIIGEGRAGGSLGRALADVGITVSYLHRGDALNDVTANADVVVIATPDSLVGPMAVSFTPADDVVVLHLSGALGLDQIRHHPRHGSLHPLVSLPNAQTGAKRLIGCWMAISGDPAALELATILDGRTFTVPDDRRPLYHATAAVAANHLTALLGQVERLADLVGVPFEAFADLARGSLESAVSLGAAASLTGPVARSDWSTVANHLAAMPAGEVDLYVAMARAAATLKGTDFPPELEDSGRFFACGGDEAGQVGL